uniref:Uncharacterized protein n=1 Tax=Octopus bimaculoides TaxID=37653 RepID=A0A0L8HC53_OCTBM
MTRQLCSYENAEGSYKIPEVSTDRMVTSNLVYIDYKTSRQIFFLYHRFEQRIFTWNNYSLLTCYIQLRSFGEEGCYLFHAYFNEMPISVSYIYWAYQKNCPRFKFYFEPFLSQECLKIT